MYCRFLSISVVLCVCRMQEWQEEFYTCVNVDATTAKLKLPADTVRDLYFYWLLKRKVSCWLVEWRKSLCLLEHMNAIHCNVCRRTSMCHCLPESKTTRPVLIGRETYWSRGGKCFCSSVRTWSGYEYINSSIVCLFAYLTLFIIIRDKSSVWNHE